MKILLDTDIGCDIDDMYTLGYLLAREDAELVGITTVTGEADIRAKLASAMCKLADKDIPICIGADKLCGEKFVQWETVRSERELLDKYPHRTEFPTGAAEFMKDIIEKYPNEIILCAIGPLTNVAELFTKYSHTAKQIKTLVIMGGRFGEVDTKLWGENEWNIINDIEGAKAVFDAPCADVRVFGVELTCKCFGDPVKVSDAFMESAVLRPAAIAARGWKNGVWFHDAVAAASLFCDDGMTFEKGNITVTDKGETVFTKDDDGRHTLMTAMDNDLFFEHYCRTVGVKREF